MKAIQYSVLSLAFLASLAFGKDAPEETRFRVLGLFMEVRAEAFKAEIARHEEIELVKLDYKNGEALLRLHGLFKQRSGNRENQLNALNHRIRISSGGAFELAPAHGKPLSKLTRVEIPIKGHNCLGCSFGVYRAVYKQEGVHRVTSDFGQERMVAWTDPQIISVADLEAALLKKKVITNYRIDGANLVPPREMSIVRASSEATRYDGAAVNAIDGDSQTKWESNFVGEVAKHPHELVIDLGKTRSIAGFRYLARQAGDVGQFAKAEFYVSDDPKGFESKPIAKATFQPMKSAQAADCKSSVSGRYVLVRVLSEIKGRSNASAAEIGVVEVMQ